MERVGLRWITIGLLVFLLLAAYFVNTENSFSKTSAHGTITHTFFTQIEDEIRNKPTTQKNAQIRDYRLTTLARLLLQEFGPTEIDPILSPNHLTEISSLLEARNFEKACPLIDQAFLGLCKIGVKSPFLSKLSRISFKSKSGAEIVGYLVTPKKPTGAAFIFGHGGFGNKENWLDVMRAIAENTNTYALSIDFEGVGESSGYSAWGGANGKGRMGNFSAAMDYLQNRFGVRRFGVGGHSGGGAYPAACATIEDKRISTLILWDCPFDFYDMHIVPGATDPGGNPACLLDRTSRLAQGRFIVPTEVASFRKIGERIDTIYKEIETTMSKYRHPSKMLGELQKKRHIAVLHIIAEDVVRQIGERAIGETFFLMPVPAATERARFFNRPLPFYASGLFDRPKDMWKRWHDDLKEPKKVVLIPKTTHGFEPPGRQEAIKETVEWINKFLAKSQ